MIAATGNVEVEGRGHILALRPSANGPERGCVRSTSRSALGNAVA